MAAIADSGIELLERPKLELTDFVKSKAASAVQSTLDEIWLIR